MTDEEVFTAQLQRARNAFEAVTETWAKSKWPTKKQMKELELSFADLGYTFLGHFVDGVQP